MKVILKECKIYGYDAEIYRAFQNDGKETKQYSVALYISDADKAVIDSFLYQKVSVNADGENIFYGKAKQPIPIFDTEKVRITKPVNEVFLADVSILIDEFEKDGENIRYSKCLGIKYLKKVENEEPKLPPKVYTDFDDIFADETELVIPTIIAPPLQEIVNNDPLNVNAPIGGVGENGLPF